MLVGKKDVSSVSDGRKTTLRSKISMEIWKAIDVNERWKGDEEKNGAKQIQKYMKCSHFPIKLNIKIS